MSKRSSYKIKKDILWVIKEKSATYAELERKVDTGYRTIKSNCEELEGFGQVEVKKIPKHPSNGRRAFLVSITESGTNFMKKMG